MKPLRKCSLDTFDICLWSTRIGFGVFGSIYSACTQITGILDITKVVYHIQQKISNSWGKAQSLQSAFADFQSAHQSFQASPEVQLWFETWGNKMAEPELSNFIDYTRAPPQVTLRTSVRDAAKLMKEQKVTAVLVNDQQGFVAFFIGN